MTRWEKKDEIPKDCKGCKHLFETNTGFDCSMLIEFDDCPY